MFCYRVKALNDINNILLIVRLYLIKLLSDMALCQTIEHGRKIAFHLFQPIFFRVCPFSTQQKTR